jgi:cation transport ATPase
VAVALPSPTGSSGEWAVMLASDDVRHGALAISLARRTKIEARTSLIIALAPPVVCSLFVGFGLFPLACAPISGLAGAVCATFHARLVDRTRSLAGPEIRRPSPRLRGRLVKTT